jgi:transcriptional regulator NrdR family protein
VTEKRWTHKPKCACPTCGSFESLVIRGHADNEGGYKRTRRCRGCSTRYVTAERVERVVRPKAA